MFTDLLFPLGHTCIFWAGLLSGVKSATEFMSWPNLQLGRYLHLLPNQHSLIGLLSCHLCLFTFLSSVSVADNLSCSPECRGRSMTLFNFWEVDSESGRRESEEEGWSDSSLPSLVTLLCSTLFTSSTASSNFVASSFLCGLICSKVFLWEEGWCRILWTGQSSPWMHGRLRHCESVNGN